MEKPTIKDVAVGALKVSRLRSPNYPSIGLKKAVEQIDGFYQAYKKAFVPMPVVHKHLGFAAGGSIAAQRIAAFKAYGLVDVQGESSKAEMRISERAYRILLNHSDREGLLRAAALDPAIHSELWKKYGDDGLPPDDAMRHYLVFERNFNPATVDAFITQFKDTISFAKLDSSDKIAKSEDREIEDESPENGKDIKVNEGQGVVDPAKSKTQNPPIAPAGHKDFPAYLSNNKRAILYIPATMTAKDYDLLKKQIENHLLVIEATSISEENQN